MCIDKDKKLLNFLYGNDKNFDNLYINDIWNFTNEQLEYNHKYIQWIFPIKERSKYNIFAPKIYDIQKYLDPIIQENIKKSFIMMLHFYGLKLEKNKIIQDIYFNEISKKWLLKNNHNFLRITRILKCLRLFDLQEEAKMFFDCLYDIYLNNSDIISDKTLFIWKTALNS